MATLDAVFPSIERIIGARSYAEYFQDLADRMQYTVGHVTNQGLFANTNRVTCTKVEPSGNVFTRPNLATNYAHHTSVVTGVRGLCNVVNPMYRDDDELIYIPLLTLDNQHSMDRYRCLRLAMKNAKIKQIEHTMTIGGQTSTPVCSTYVELLKVKGSLYMQMGNYGDTLDKPIVGVMEYCWFDATNATVWGAVKRFGLNESVESWIHRYCPVSALMKTRFMKYGFTLGLFAEPKAGVKAKDLYSDYDFKLTNICVCEADNMYHCAPLALRSLTNFQHHRSIATVLRKDICTTGIQLRDNLAGIATPRWAKEALEETLLPSIFDTDASNVYEPFYQVLNEGTIADLERRIEEYGDQGTKSFVAPLCFGTLRYNESMDLSATNLRIYSELFLEDSNDINAGYTNEGVVIGFARLSLEEITTHEPSGKKLMAVKTEFCIDSKVALTISAPVEILQAHSAESDLTLFLLVDEHVVNESSLMFSSVFGSHTQFKELDDSLSRGFALAGNADDFNHPGQYVSLRESANWFLALCEENQNGTDVDSMFDQFNPYVDEPKNIKYS